MSETKRTVEGRECCYCHRNLPVTYFPLKPGKKHARYKSFRDCHALGHSCIPKEKKPQRVYRKYLTEEERKEAQLEYQRRYREKHRDRKRASTRACYWHRKGMEPPDEPQKRGPKKKGLTQEQRKVMAKQEAADTGRFYCSMCHRVMPAENFTSGGMQYKMCNVCREKQRTRKPKKAKESKPLNPIPAEDKPRKPKGQIGSNPRFEYHRQYWQENKERVKAKRCIDLDQSKAVVTDKRIVTLYLKGYSLSDISSRCRVRIQHVKEVIERDGCVKCEVRLCCDCWLYPCFSGMDAISSNLALTCQKWHRKEDAS